MDGASTGISPVSIPGLIWAYRFASDGTATRVADGRAQSEVVGHHEGWLWLHLDLSDPGAKNWISSAQIPLPKGARDLILSDEKHVRLQVFEGTVAGLFADLRRDAGASAEDIGFLRFALNERLVVSARHRSLHSVKQAREDIDGGKRLESAVGLLESIVEKFADASTVICDELADKVNSIEDQIMGERAGDERKQLNHIRRSAVRLHRQLTGLHTLFVRIDRFDKSNVSPEFIDAAQRLASRLDTIHHDLFSVQERARLLQEEIADKMNEQANRLLYIISILTALFVPPTFVTGIFGMNTKGLIFADSENAFVYAILMCGFSAAAVYAVVKWVGRSR